MHSLFCSGSPIFYQERINLDIKNSQLFLWTSGRVGKGAIRRAFSTVIFVSVMGREGRGREGTNC